VLVPWVSGRRAQPGAPSRKVSWTIASVPSSRTVCFHSGTRRPRFKVRVRNGSVPVHFGPSMVKKRPERGKGLPGAALDAGIV